ncbi:MAG: CotH kinase family protein [Lachnospiraceae bacterium]|nr:CotH kinase family protein [Lachnospiraceae bacterium]
MIGRVRAALLLSVLLLAAYVGLRLYADIRTPVSCQDITVTVESQGIQTRLRLWHNYYDNKEYLFLPSFCGQETTARIAAGGSYMGDKLTQKSWDGTKLKEEMTAGLLTDGEHVLQAKDTEFTIVVMRSSAVPALFVTTESGSLSYIEAVKGNGEPGLYRMVESDGSVRASGTLKKLKSRGNATFLEDKKPYQMTLDDAADLLGSGMQDKYILLANRQDQSLLRDRIMYDMSAEMGLDYSAVSRFVDLYVNEEYRGSYQLCEKVETGHGRMEINTETKETETGFLVTLEYAATDRLAEADYYFTTSKGQNVVVKRPKNPTAAQLTYIEDCFQGIEDMIAAGELDMDRLDVTSFARKYLVEEIGKNLDAMYTSQYFYREAVSDAGGDLKLYAGPVWDYDKTLGNPLIEHNRPVNYQEPRGIFAATKQENASWWYDLYQIPAFYEAVVEEYEKTAIPAIETMLDGRIDEYRDEIWDSAYMDYMRWDPFEDFKYGEELEFEREYQAEIDNIKAFLAERKEFLGDIWLEGRAYHQITCDPGDGVMYVTQIDAIEGRMLKEPRDPKLEGYKFDHWVREDTGEAYDFTESYDGVPFTLQAVYVKEE